MNYSICSDLYRIEDNDPAFPFSSVPLEDDTPAESDVCLCDFEYYDMYEEEYDCDPEYDEAAEYYAANDPSNWD